MAEQVNLLKLKCPEYPEPDYEGLLTAELAFEKRGVSVYCPELEIHLWARNCRRASRDFLSAVLDYYEALCELPEDHLGVLQLRHLELYREKFIPALAAVLAENPDLVHTHLRVRTVLGELAHVLFDAVVDMWASWRRRGEPCPPEERDWGPALSRLVHLSVP